MTVFAPSVDGRSRVSDIASSKFIAGPLYDRVFFIFTPLLALAAGVIFSMTPLVAEKFTLNGKSESWVSLFGGALTMAHLFIVFFRSHGNPGIFRLYPRRFLAVPVFLFSAMMLSSWVLVFCFVLAVWWDAYHSALQTFGLGRLYDLKAGSLSDETRRLDRGLNLVIYLGPILGGAVLMDHAGHFNKFKDVGSAFFSVIPVWTSANHRALSLAAVFFGSVYVFYYLMRYRALLKEGQCVSPEKALLFASTAICSVYTWGLNSFGQAFFIMNFFHAVQYFALIWLAEKERIRFWPLLLGVGFAYGIWAKLWGESSHLAMSVLLTVSLLHFWYDGFIWSVRKKDKS